MVKMIRIIIDIIFSIVLFIVILLAHHSAMEEYIDDNEIYR